MPVVVAINRFKDDSDAEVELLKSKCLEAGAAGAVMANHWAEGGKGALELAEKVVEVYAEVRILQLFRIFNSIEFDFIRFYSSYL